LSIFDFLKKNPEYYEIFKYSFSSDEVFFHTILNNLNFSIYQNHPTPSNLYGLHYIDWSDRVKNPPKILQVEDLDSIRNLNNVFFVRKVSPDDVAFLDAIDML
ncbi:hypothetical protein FC650_01460, partial [Vibrio natriegens]|uniref:beta-1,6-N-acetylglucosaminyltransferase n=1 Tax=Vibrio natriegens TaxID=691 RepID=UPI001C3E20F2